MSVYEKIAQLGIMLPEVTPPVAAFVPFVRSGKQIFVSGHIAKENGKPWVGQLGLNITTELGIRAAAQTGVGAKARFRRKPLWKVDFNASLLNWEWPFSRDVRHRVGEDAGGPAWVARWPAARITLRQAARVIEDSRRLHRVKP